MHKICSGLMALVLAAAGWLPLHAEAAGRAWTGLVYVPNAPASGTAERALFDGKNALRNHMPAMAKDLLQRATRMDPTLAEAFFWLAGAHRALKEGGEAQAALKKAVQLDPSLQAHAGELDRFGPASAKAAGPSGKPASSSRCDDLYASCRASATRCGMNGCQTDFGRQASCTAERNQCERRNGR